DTDALAAVITVNDYRQLTSYNMPRHFFQATCRHQLYDVGCNANGNMNRSAFMQTGAIAAGSTRSTVVAASLVTPGGSKTYSLGQLQFTSGQNTNFWAFIVQWDGNVT